MSKNDEKANTILKSALPDLFMIKEIVDSNDIPIQEVMRMLYLISNIKKMTQWGKVVILIKDGEIVAVQQEQQFITSRELERIRR